MKTLVSSLLARPWMASSVLAGCVAAAMLPGSFSAITRGLFGWNVAVWLYLILVGAVMLRADHGRLQRIAAAHAEGASVVLTVVVLTASVSLAGIVAELAAAKVPGVPHSAPHLAFALVTVTGSWLLLPTVFALTYASVFYGAGKGGGLKFPDAEPAFAPNYADFMYFSLTIAVASQTSDVSVVTSAVRRLVLMQSVVSFAFNFNTAILAFTINVAASMF